MTLELVRLIFGHGVQRPGDLDLWPLTLSRMSVMRDIVQYSICASVCGSVTAGGRAVSEPYYSLQPARAQCLRLSERFFDLKSNIGHRILVLDLLLRMQRRARGMLARGQLA